MQRIAKLLMGLAFAAMAAATHAQYPVRPISMVIPFPPVASHSPSHFTALFASHSVAGEVG